MQVTVHAAKTQLPKLIEAVLRGEEVIIARGREPVVRLVAIPRTTFKIGLLEGQVTGPGPDFFEPMDAEDLDLGEGGRSAPLNGEICLMAGTMDWPHRDPFDRLLAATALIRRMPLVSADAIFDGRVTRIW